MARTPIHPGEHLAEQLKTLDMSAAGIPIFCARADLRKVLMPAVPVFQRLVDRLVPPRDGAVLSPNAGGQRGKNEGDEFLHELSQWLMVTEGAGRARDRLLDLPGRGRHSVRPWSTLGPSMWREGQL